MEKRAFTLIELLIVVAIIAILAAIAVPNFLEAQTRAKVSRVKSDMAAVSTALEAYYIDENAYPFCVKRGPQVASGGIHHAVGLSTPVAYISSVSLADPFIPPIPPDKDGWVAEGITFSIMYVNIQGERKNQKTLPGHFAQWLITSNGPDTAKGPGPQGESGWWILHYADMRKDKPVSKFALCDYDPSNGTKSAGDINRWSTGQSN